MAGITAEEVAVVFGSGMLPVEGEAGQIRLSDIVNVDVSLSASAVASNGTYRGLLSEADYAVDHGPTPTHFRSLRPDDFQIDSRSVYEQYAQYIRGSCAKRAPMKKVSAPSRKTLVSEPAVAEDDLDLTQPRRLLAIEAEGLLGYTPLLKDAGTPGKLRRALAELEIETLNQDSVDKYKAQMVQHYASHQKLADPTWRITSLKAYTQPVPEYVLRKACQIKRTLPDAEFYVDQLAVDPFLIVSLVPLKDFMTNQATRALDPEQAAYVEVWDEPKFEK